MTEAVQTAVDTQPKRYPLTQTEFEVQISVGGKTLSHKLRRPTLAELVTRESESVTEVEEVSPGEDAFHVEDKAATARLWDKIRLQVKGYRTGDAKPDEWIDVTPELAAKLPADHKVAAVRALYLFRVEMVEDEGDGFDLDGQEYDIRQLIGGDEDAPAGAAGGAGGPCGADGVDAVGKDRDEADRQREGEGEAAGGQTRAGEGGGKTVEGGQHIGQPRCHGDEVGAGDGGDQAQGDGAQALHLGVVVGAQRALLAGLGDQLGVLLRRGGLELGGDIMKTRPRGVPADAVWDPSSRTWRR